MTITTTQLEAAGFTRRDFPNPAYDFYNKVVDGRAIQVTVVHGEVWPVAISTAGLHDVDRVQLADYL